MTTKPSTISELEERLTQLEIKASFADDTIDHLNTQIYRQQLQIERLQRDLQTLGGQLQNQAPPAFRSLRDELPPHY